MNELRGQRAQPFLTTDLNAVGQFSKTGWPAHLECVGDLPSGQLSKVSQLLLAELQFVGSLAHTVLWLLDDAGEAGQNPPEEAPADQTSGSQSYLIH